ncbi:MAG: AcrB/AcrD/AcrF family protein [Chitinivibrionales bacterium]|nr:AcrB/AcrD/AcrF family protein [Chitinivibrionales bacterium]
MVKFFVKKHAAVFCFAALVILVGVVAYATLPRESFPEIEQPYVFVTTFYPGVAARDMENLVTRPIEEELDGLEGLKEVTSSSQQSLSLIWTQFTSDVKVETALRRVRERVDIAKAELPDDAEEPLVQEFTSSTFPVYIMVLSHPDGLEAIDKVSQNLQDRFKRVPGVLDCELAGNRTKEVAIELDPVKMEHFGLAIDDVSYALQMENVNIPGGQLKNKAKNYTIEITGEIQDPRTFEEIMINKQGKSIKLKQVGTARFGYAAPETYSRFNGNPCITLSISKRSGENIIDVVDNVNAALDEIRDQLPAGTKVGVSYDSSDEIKDMILDLENNMFSAFVLVLLVTIFFLGFVNSLFVSLAIPFSMLMSFFMLQLMGITLNMIVLFSLILALGMLVDNGIVIVENIFRHASMGKSRMQSAIDGAQEVAGPIVASTITTCLAFFPIIFMPDIMGDIMAYVPKTVITVLLCSLAVALTINPVACSHFMSISEKNMKKITEGSGTFVKFQNWYANLIEGALSKAWVVVIISFAVVFTGIFLYSIGGKEPIFFPELDPSVGIVDVTAPQGAPLDKTDAIMRELEKIVPQSPSSMKSMQTTTGKGADDGFGGPAGSEYHKGNINVNYKRYVDRKIKGKVAIDSLKKRLEGFTGAEVKVKPIEMGPPTGNDISYEIVGQDYAVMGAYADTLIHILERYTELKLIETDFESAKPEVSVSIDRKKAAFYGLSTMGIASTVRNAINGGIVGKYRQDKDEYDIIVRYKQGARNSINQLSGLQIVNNDGDRIPLSSVAEITTSSAVGIIKRRNLYRAVNVYADFREGTQNKREISEEIETRFGNVVMPEGYRVQPGEGFAMRKDATVFLAQAFAVALFLIAVVLVGQFNSFMQPLIIMISVFLSIGGVFWGYFLSGQEFVIIMSGIGCISLAGVAVNNCIVLVDYTNLLIKSGTHWRDAVIEAGKTRLRPVLLTAITTVLGLIPMALGVSFDIHKFTFQVGSESSEFWTAFAWAMIYGLSFATVMTLVVVPSLLSLYYRYTVRHSNNGSAIHTGMN